MSDLCEQLFRQVFKKQVTIGRAPVDVVRAQAGIDYVRRYQRVVGTQCVRAIARPGICLRSLDHPCPDGIQFDVAVADQQISFGVDETGAEPAFP
ncbi:hypothetical protein IA69_18490 [Massilia sp. JS1662]|nr:hypothetical protein IA69_18490 [Massilia sp. JS1662]